MRTFYRLIVFCAVIVIFFTVVPEVRAAQQGQTEYDIIIRNTSIIDGTGSPAWTGDVAVKEGRIAAVGTVSGSAGLEIDGSGLVTCPGFIDPHSHADLSIMQYPLAENLVPQGITTFLGGNCGTSSASSVKKAARSC